ncbi:MAG: hypothetical protein MJ099_05735 [Clostridia bacterium]|nr:hypothetical protein [Clostridia bacterium]
MKTTFAVIEFGTSKIVTIIAQGYRDTTRLDILGTGSVPYDGFSGGDWNTPEQMVQCLHESIAAAEYDAKQKVSEIYIGVPGEMIHVYTAEAELETNGVITEQDKEALADLAADKLNLMGKRQMVLHRAPAWYSIDDGEHGINNALPERDGQEVKGNNLKGCVSFVTAEPFFMEDLREMCKRLNLTILGWLSPTYALTQYLLKTDERDRGAVIVDFGYLNTEITVCQGDAIVYHATLPDGAGFVTAELCNALSVHMNEGEQIKRNYTFSPDELEEDAFVEVTDRKGRVRRFNREQVKPIIETHFEELAEMIKQTLEQDAAAYMTPRTGIYMTGGGLMQMRGGREFISAKLGRPIKSVVTESTRLNSSNYSSAMALADLVANCICGDDYDSPKKGKGNILNLFRRNK